MWDKLPTEITIDILQRLGVKTLIKCTTLSKSFLSLITSQSFISTHVAKNSNSHLLLRYITPEKEEKYHFEPDDDNFSGFQTQELPVPFLNYPDSDKCWTIAGCVNGVVCLVNDFGTEGTLIILWNPSIRKFVHVPRPIIVFGIFGPYQSFCGFGYDSISDDYKVVRVVDLDSSYDWDAPTAPTTAPPAKVEVFSLKSGCWRFIGDGPNYLIKLLNYAYIPRFINGSVYWVGSSIMERNKHVILKFDMSTESFEIIQLPGILIENELTFTRYDLYILECKGKLSLIKRNYDYNDMIVTCNVWVMKEDEGVKSWTKMCDSSIAKSRSLAMPKAFAFRKNGEVIMVKGGRNVVVSIDLVKHSQIALKEMNVDFSQFYLSTYVESMVLFKEGKGIGDQTTPLDLLRE